MDFFTIKEREGKKGVLEVYPDFQVARSKDLMIKGRAFYAIWDEKAGLWSTDEYDVQRLVDEELANYEVKTPGVFEVHRRFLGDFSTNSWLQFRHYLREVSDSSVELDRELTFSNTEVKKGDYVSRRLPYPLTEGSIEAWDELVGTLYDEEERAKIEWAIGAVMSGDSKTIQKFLVFYGGPGTGKSTILNIIQWLTPGYYTTFEARQLTSENNSFSTEVFKSNPLVAINHDGDLSKISDNTKLNAIISHEEMTVNEKYKPAYTTWIAAFLFMGTNKPVKITDAKSGIIRRLIDVQPTGAKIGSRHYQALMAQIKFELGAIAAHCLKVYRAMGKDYYSGYRPIEMMLQTDVFFNFIEANYDFFYSQDGVTLNRAHEMYKEFCTETLVEWTMPRYKFREELKNYFTNFEDRARVNDLQVRSWYSGFNADKFKTQSQEDQTVFSLVMDEDISLLDDRYSDYPAQYSKADGTPSTAWDKVKKTLSQIDTTREHYVNIPEQEIVIDFDLRDAFGQKSAERNLEAASQWPSTYAEYSKSEAGIHLHYFYDGDVAELARQYDDGIEIKVYTGDAALRRKLSKCNNVPVATLTGGLPLKEKKVMNETAVKSERGLREMIARNLRKEFHAGTKSSIDFIHKILEDAYESDLAYDVTDLRPAILAFANNSTNQSLAAIKTVTTMQFQSEESKYNEVAARDDREVIFDTEVFPNLFVVSWKFRGKGNKTTSMINPSPAEIEELLKFKLIGFNCRRYDNHILHGRLMGFDNERLYKLSQRLINKSANAFFGEAWDHSYADIFEFATKIQGLKKWQIELGLKHQELGYPWDQPVPEKLWKKVCEYCENDVESTEAVLDDRQQDYIAKQILAELSGLPVNATVQQHASQIIFEGERKPQAEFVYTNLSEMFPGYKFEMGQSTYRGEITGEGGYVYAEPGMYYNVALLDADSMHPTSIEQLEAFGPKYTKNFSEIKRARIAIKRGDLESAKMMLGGILTKYLTNEADIEALSYALKIVINKVYGLTSAGFDNSFRDPRNIDNIVAKRGALFMVDLKNAVQEKGFQVVHIKTDSIKIPNATPEIIQFVMEFGEQYGYSFTHEATFERFCLVNDAVYIAKTQDGRKPSHWEAVGAQFQHPYVFKKLFTHEPIKFRDRCETKSVVAAEGIYLDFTDLDQDIPAVLIPEVKHFVGKTGLFTPMARGGARLVAKNGEKWYAVTGAKDFLWLESDMVKELGKEKDIDEAYFEGLVQKAKDNIGKFGDFEAFASA